MHLLYSLSKSFTAAAVGIAVRAGLVDLDAPVVGHFPELDAEVTDERTRRMRVRHLLAMASGHRSETIDHAEAIDPTNTVRGFLLLPLDEEPGSVFAYNQPCTYTLAEIVRRASGTSLLEYLRPRLFAPPRHRRLLVAPRRHRRGTRVQRRLHDDGRDRRTRSAVPAARRVGRRTRPRRGLDRAGHERAGGEPGRGGPGLVAGVRLPVLDGPARLPR
ncbi:serine hydrolase domain-containing protein [Curtobacterium sp. MCJR17_043]|uniref:serine hydrolase domain-containing protein n=1 Tax=Curtobacterium sp. MCJR17_043 TaxID=2175660 RepID=UPI0032E8FCC6